VARALGLRLEVRFSGHEEHPEATGEEKAGKTAFAGVEQSR